MNYSSWYLKEKFPIFGFAEVKSVLIEALEQKVSDFAEGLGVSKDELERALRTDRENEILARPRESDPSDW